MIDFIFFAITLHQLFAKSTDHYLWPAEFENVAHPDFENINHLQNPVHLSLTALSMSQHVISITK